MASWAPQTCTLPTAEQPLRVAEFDGLFASALRHLDRPEPLRLRMELEPTPEVAATTAGLAARETRLTTHSRRGSGSRSTQP